MVPTTRQQFADFCLRKLGAPVISIELDEMQIDDRIDEALQYYRDYHYNGSEQIYLKHQLLQIDKDNGYITIGDPSVFAITNMFNIGSMMNYSMTDIFSVNYQIALNDLWNLSSFSMIPYYLGREQIQLIQDLLIGKTPIRFNQLTNQIHIDMNWNNVSVGEYLIFTGFKTLDSTVYSTIWGERWLQNYTTVLLKEQWAGNLSKYDGAQLISGMRFNWSRLLDDAQRERKKLEDEMLYSFSMPVSDISA